MATMFSVALVLAAMAHDGQKDKGGHPYILHPMRVASHMNSDTLRAAAVLHDCFEDTDMTEEELLESGISPGIVELVHVLTQREEETYTDYVMRVSKNRLATIVKIADLNDNIDLTRIPADQLTEKDFKRQEKYVMWRDYLVKSAKEKGLNI